MIHIIGSEHHICAEYRMRWIRKVLFLYLFKFFFFFFFFVHNQKYLHAGKSRHFVKLSSSLTNILF